MKSLYISRVSIKNYRNFKDIDVNLDHKQVIIGENNVGKTNFLRALQLVLDPSFSDEDRYLEESDFFDGLEDPMVNKEVVEIKIYISNYEGNKNILAQLSDATIRDDNEEKLLITYRYFPFERDNGEIEYQYIIFKGLDENNSFTYEDRRYLNIKVIKALRDVEGEMKNSKTSPVTKLLKYYSIDKNDMDRIAEKFKDGGLDVVDLDEIVDLSNNINNRFSSILGINNDFIVSLRAMEIDPNKLINSLRVYLSNRNISDISLGLNNILYISLVLLLLRDNTIPSYLKKDKYEDYLLIEGGDILVGAYEENSKGNYFLKKNLNKELLEALYIFMDTNESISEGVTILAIEEPEAHLHPTYQRLIYKDVIRESDNSVLLTTHSTHITSIAPIKSIVHLHSNMEGWTSVSATKDLDLSDEELLDLQRYVDVKRGEIYLGRGVILVEGITEEYLLPRFAEQMDCPLDEKGIIVCNISSTNFKPYVKLLEKLNIPYVVITDGDFYYNNVDIEGKITKKFHSLYIKVDNRSFGYLGLEIVKDIILDLGIREKNEIPTDINEQDDLFKKLGFYIGNYTFEVDMMEECSKSVQANNIIIDIFNTLTIGGDIQKSNFKNELISGDYWKCLKKIESNGIGKGRFAQQLSQRCTLEHIPGYIHIAIKSIYEMVVGF